MKQALAFPVRDSNNAGIPSIDKTRLISTSHWASLKATSEHRATLNWPARVMISGRRWTFIFLTVRNNESVYLDHLLNVESGKLSGHHWDVYADEGGLVAWVAFKSGGVTWEEYQSITESQMRRSSTWISPCTAKTYVVEEAAWFNAMFTWGSRALHGFPAGELDGPAGTASRYTAAAFAPAVEAHLDYGECVLGIDYPIISDSPSQADDEAGLVGRYTPPNLAGEETTETPEHIATHGPFVPFNSGPALSSATLERLIDIIEKLKTDAAGYYHDDDSPESSIPPYGFEVIASPFYNDIAYEGADQGRGVFETLNQAFIVLSLFNGLQLNEGEALFSTYAAQDPEHELAMQQTLQYLYPTPSVPWCVVGDFIFGSDRSPGDPSDYPPQQDVRIRADCVKPGSNTILLEAVQPAKAYRWLVWDSLSLASASGDVIWALGEDEAPPDHTGNAFDEFDDTLPFSIDFDVETMGADDFPFQLNDNALPQVYITFELTPARSERDLILDLDTLYATHDDVDSFTIRVQVNALDKTYTWSSQQPPPPDPEKPLVLIYAVLDNNLDGGWERLVNNIEKGVHADANVRLMVDAFGMDENDAGEAVSNAWVYDVRYDENSLCPSFSDRTCGYTEGETVRRFVTEDTAHASSLYRFIGDSLLAYPNPTQVILVLVGHGSGWSADLLPGQPSGWQRPGLRRRSALG